VEEKVLRNVEIVKDLDLHIDKRLTFNSHISQVIRGAKRNLNFILRYTKPFKNYSAILTLYYALVRSNLEFCAVIWNPTTKTQSCKHAWKNTISFSPVPFLLKLFEYYPTELHTWGITGGFEFTTLKSRRWQASVLFLRDLINGEITEANLLAGVSVRVPSYQST